ncbi:Transporter mfs1 [Madurella mycetomatis]|uniref:Transporter mfs1 n=1 Tax=Madurella mycetomatis TaxID=100816 RepID=A0A175VV52_9PEZI|nr:Transporter mfs1 [Madurella mycetomatis]
MTDSDSPHQPSHPAPDPRPVEHRYLTFSTDLTSGPSPVSDSDSSSGNNNRHCHSHQHDAIRGKFSDPQTWPPLRKSLVTYLSCLATFVTTYTPGAYAAGFVAYRAEWPGLSSTAVYAGITLFTLCFAVAPMMLASFSELAGRRPLFLAAGAIFVASQLGSAVTASFAGLLVTRALAGLSCSVFSTVVGGVISDMYVARERNTAMAIFTGAALCGTGVGPVVSGVVVERLGWRWIYYVQTISCGVVVGLLVLFFPETRGSVLLSRRAKALNKWYDALEREGGLKAKGPTVRWRVKADEERDTVGKMLKTSVVRPMHLLVTESVVFWFSLWMSFAWTILYLTFEAVPLMFALAYDFSPQESGLVFLAVSVSSVLGTAGAVWQEKLLLTSKLQLIARFRGQPEARLLFACGQSILLPAGLFWLGSTTSHAIHWIVPALAVGCLTLGIFGVYLAVFNYLADTYHAYASSAIAAQAFTRNVFAACLPLAVEPMLDRLGFVGTGCVLGAVGLGLSAVPWVLVLWGPRIRKRSKLLDPDLQMLG